MPLNIKDEETDRLARELAAATGQSITVAVREALAAQLQSVNRRERMTKRDVLAEVIERGRLRPTLDDRAEDEVLGYDDFGLPR
jgi:antitoxin VapB